jgi:ligand-binding sensor domain-containing protein
MKKVILLSILCWLCSCIREGDVSPEVLDQWVYFTISHGLVDDQVTSLYEDDQGNMWIGTTAGLSVFNGSSFTNYTIDDGLLSNEINSIIQDRDGTMWVATSNGINVLIDDTWYYLIVFGGYETYSLAETADEDILVGIMGEGVYRYDLSENEVYGFYVDFTCAPCNIPYAILRDSENTIWVGTDDGLKRIIGSSVTSYTTDEGLSGNSVTAVTEDRWGNIWAGTFDGRTVSRIRNGQVEELNLANSFTQNWIWDIAVDNAGVLWISTAIAGLYRYDGAVMRKDFVNLPDEYVSALYKDSRGNMWIGTLFDGLIVHTQK